MKKLILFSLLLTVSSMSTAAFGQSTIPSLGKLMAWANNMSYANFDKEARKFGFSFDEKEEEENRIDYIYLREVTQGSTIYTEKLKYRILKSDRSTAIMFGTSRVDLIIFYSDALTANRFASIDCVTETEKNQTAFCYQTVKFFVRLMDEKTSFDNGVGNGYSIAIFKR